MGQALATGQTFLINTKTPCHFSVSWWPKGKCIYINIFKLSLGYSYTEKLLIESWGKIILCRLYFQNYLHFKNYISILVLLLATSRQMDSLQMDLESTIEITCTFIVILLSHHVCYHSSLIKYVTLSIFSYFCIYISFYCLIS